MYLSNMEEPSRATAHLNGCTILGHTTPPGLHGPRQTETFFNIPYARTSRFQPAVSVSSPAEWGSPFDAREEGPSVPFPLAPQHTVEDILTLSIVRPSDAKDKAPVVVYVHGGAYNFGVPLERDFASFLSRAEGDLIVVGISYRLGALGFLSGLTEQDAKDDGLVDMQINAGLHDQRVAVGWVRDNIAQFGGDPASITLMGVSAGAHSIGHHMLNPQSLGFTKAILESGAPTARSVLSPHHPRTLAQCQSLLAHVRKAGSKLAPTPRLATMPVEELLNAAVQVWTANAAAASWPFQPVVDGEGGCIPDLPLSLWDKGQEGLEAVVLGFVSHEGTGFVPERAGTNAQFRGFFANLLPSFTASDLDALEALYPDPVTDPSSPYANDRFPQGYPTPRLGAQFKRLHTAYAHWAYICPILHTAHRLSTSTLPSGATRRVYLYEYAALAAPYRTANHGDQAPIVAYDESVIGGKPGLMDVAGAMHGRWTAFALSKTGDLGERWPVFQSPFEEGEGRGEMLVFGQGNDELAGGKERGSPVQTRTVTAAEREQCRFWWKRMRLSEGMGED